MLVSFQKLVLMIAAMAAVFYVPHQVDAALIYVGSWDVYENPNAPTWSSSPPNGPLAYTGQEAAALLFGGSPSDYSISTIGTNPSNVNNMAWYDTIGIGGSVQAEDWNIKHLGLYYGPTSGYTGEIGISASSALIQDNLGGQGRLNYAFVNDTAAVPEPSSLVLLGITLPIYMFRRRSAKTWRRVAGDSLQE